MSRHRTPAATSGDSMGPRRSLGTFVKGIGSLLLLFVFIAGVPYVLVRIGAVPTSLPDPGVLWRSLTGPDLSGRGVLVVLTALVWVGWLWFTLSVLREAVAAFASRGRGTRQLSQQAARRTAGNRSWSVQPAAVLVAAVAAMFVTAPLLAAGAPPAAAAGQTSVTGSTARSATVATAAQHPSHVTSAGIGATSSGTTRAAAPPASTAARATAKAAAGQHSGSTTRYTVHRHDNLWTIAQHQLGDPTRYREIVALNPHLKHNTTIHVGDVLILPSHGNHAGAPAKAPAKPPTQAPAKTPAKAPPVHPGTAGSPVAGPVVHETVEAGDTVSGIAAEHGIRDWHIVWDANKGRAEPGGKHFTNPDHIEVGWDLAIPTGAASAPPASTASTASPTDSAAGSATPGPVPDAAPSSAAPSSTRPSDTAPASGDEHRDGQPGQPAATTQAQPPGPGLNAAQQQRVEQRLEHQDQQQGGPDRQGTSAEQTPSPATPTTQPAPQAALEQAPESSLATTAAYVAGGAVLAAGLYAALVLVRRQQWRDRRPGRTVASTPEPLIPLERSIVTAGAPSAQETVRIDQVLRRVAATDIPLLHVAAVQLHGGHITVHLSEPATLPAPWRQGDGADDSEDWRHPVDAAEANGSGPAPAHPGQHGTAQEAFTWTFPADLDPSQAGDDPSIVDAIAPFPTLVHIGSDATSAWLLNLEQAGGLVLTGDRDRCLALARVMSAQLGVNAWADIVAVTMLGFGQELVETAPTRLRYAPAEAADQVLASATGSAQQTADSVGQLGLAVVEARRTAAGDEAWPVHVLLATTDAITSNDTTDSAAGFDVAPAGLVELLDVVDQRAGQTGAAVVVVEGQRHIYHLDQPGGHRGALVAHLDAGGTLTLPQVGLTVQAIGWDDETSRGVGALMSHLRNAPDQAVPAAKGEQPWAQVADAAGALRPELVQPRSTPSVHDSQRPVGATMLPLSDEVYVEAGATTAEDLQVLAPTVSAEVIERVMAADPTLDEDLAAWFDPASGRAKLAVLGPLTLTTQQPPPKRAPYYAEIAAYLAFREHGATAEEVMAAFSISQATNRTYLSTLRELLGKDPATGQDYMPNAKNNPAAKARGVGVYRIEGMLVDADLFRRLRVRGQARGPAGMEDYATALRLVAGPPFSKLREDGGTWLLEGDRIDHHLSLAVVDVAHALVTGALAAGDTVAARAAVDIAYLAAPDEETVRLDKAAVDVVDGRTVEARKTLREDVCNRSDDGEPPMDLNPRTRQILARHRDWLLAS